MAIEANVTSSQISASVSETQIDVAVDAGAPQVAVDVSGGFGPTGSQGPAATVAVGTVTTGAPGASASVVNAGTSGAAVLNFTIPAGATGPQGATGPAGTTTWAGITGKPSTFAPSTHQHTSADITDFAAAVVAAAPPTTNASLLTSGTLPDARLSTNIARTSDISSAVAAVVDAAPEALNTLNELAAALGDDANFASTVTTALASKAASNDARLSDSREWSADTVSQAEAEAGTATTRRAFTALRVFQAVAAWWAGSAAKTKLDGIASGATANATDAQLRDRATHTGTQTASTISDFSATASAAAPVQSVAGKTGAVTLAKADVGLGNVDNTSDASKPVSTAQAAADSAVASAAASDATTKANAAQAAAVQRANHTGTQTASTISDFVAAASAAAPVQSVAGRTGAVTIAAADVSGLGSLATSSTVAWSSVTSTPTTLAGYGITDAAASAHSHSGADITSGTISGNRLPVATDTSLGGVRVGSFLTVGGLDGILAVSTGTSSSTVCVGNDARLSDSREWSADTVSQAEAEAGTATTRRAWTATRVFQAIAAWWAASAAKTKLDGIASGATANSTDSQLRDRSTHTGTQAASTISDFTTAAAAAAPVQSVAGRTGAVTLTSADVGLGNVDNTSDASKPVSTAQAAADSAVGSAAAADATSKANAAQAAAVQRANHTGTQTASTISDFTTAAAAAAPVQSVAGRTGAVTIAAADVSGLGSLATASTVAWSSVTSTPTTLSGYGITDAISSSSFATVAETRLGALDTKPISPARLMEAGLLTRVVFLGQAAVSSGGTNSNGSTNITHTLASNTTPNGSVYIRSQLNPGDGYWSPGSVRGFNWSRRRFGVIRLYMFASSANGVYRFSIGKTTGDVVGPLPRRGIGFEIRAGGAIWISAHNGTSLTQINSGISVQYSNIADEYRIESDGNGTVSLFRNDVFINSTTGGPTAFDNSALQVTVSSEITNGGDAANNSIMHTYPVVSIT